MPAKKGKEVAADNDTASVGSDSGGFRVGNELHAKMLCHSQCLLARQVHVLLERGAERLHVLAADGLNLDARAQTLLGLHLVRHTLHPLQQGTRHCVHASGGAVAAFGCSDRV